MVKLRLAIAGVMVLIIASLAGLVMIQRARLDTAKAQAETAAAALASAVAVNKDQARVIERMTEQRAIDDRLVNAFNRQLAAIRTDTAAVASQIDELKEIDPDAKAFLSTPVPDSVKRLFAK